VALWQAEESAAKVCLEQVLEIRTGPDPRVEERLFQATKGLFNKFGL
jgi:hypothetical protein